MLARVEPAVFPLVRFLLLVAIVALVVALLGWPVSVLSEMS